MISPLAEDRSKLGGCGDGFRDVDANDFRRPEIGEDRLAGRTHQVARNAERWYRVKIYPTRVRSGDPIPYKVALRQNGKSAIQCEGTVRWDRSEGKGHAQYAIDFDPYAKEPPQCRYEVI